MRYENEKQREYSFTDCCESLEKLIARGFGSRGMFETYSHAIGVIAMHQHYNPDRAEKILGYVREVAVIHKEIHAGIKPERICSECRTLFQLHAENPVGCLLYDEGVGAYFTCDACFVLEADADVEI